MQYYNKIILHTIFIFFASFSCSYSCKEEQDLLATKFVFHISGDKKKKLDEKNISSINLNSKILTEDYNTNSHNMRLSLSPKYNLIDVVIPLKDSFFKILLVEDNLFQQKVGMRSLKIANLNADLAINGQQAIEYASKNNYNLIIMDMLMPIMGGIEATKKLKQNPLTQDISIIAYTSTIDQETILKAFSAGCCEIVEKKEGMPNYLIDLIKKMRILENDSIATNGPSADVVDKEIKVNKVYKEEVVPIIIQEEVAPIIRTGN